MDYLMWGGSQVLSGRHSYDSTHAVKLLNEARRKDYRKVLPRSIQV